MSEAGWVELPILQWLSGEGHHDPTNKGLGWTYRDEVAMAAFERPLEDPLVEKLLILALQKINKTVDTEAKAKLAVAALRKAMSHPDKLTANRETLDLLRDGARVQLEPGEDAKTVQFIDFDPADQHLNDFTATNQYRVQGVQPVPGRHGPARQRHPARDRGVQELHHERQRLARGRPPAPPVPAPSASDADAQRLLRRRGRRRISVRNRALPRREQGRHRAPPRHLGAAG